MIVSVRLDCVNATAVAASIREVLAIIDAQTKWPDVATWESLLPKWFVDACGPEKTRDEAEKEEAAFRRMATSAQIEFEATARWSLASWLFWLQPDEREWWIVQLSVVSERELKVDLRVKGMPAPLGAFDWT